MDSVLFQPAHEAQDTHWEEILWSLYEIWGSQSGVDQISRLLGCYTLPTGKHLPTFPKDQVVQTSRFVISNTSSPQTTSTFLSSTQSLSYDI